MKSRICLPAVFEPVVENQFIGSFREFSQMGQLPAVRFLDTLPDRFRLERETKHKFAPDHIGVSLDDARPDPRLEFDQSFIGQGVDRIADGVHSNPEFRSRRSQSEPGQRWDGAIQNAGAELEKNASGFGRIRIVRQCRRHLKMVNQQCWFVNFSLALPWWERP